MGLLAPLYALAALAIVGPILFHMIRRQPQGRREFSSLMFLKPSQPRMKRRSKLDNWFLLLLRVLALGLIALAFARPFFRESSFLDLNLSGRNVVILADTSASMRRDGVWQNAQQVMEDVLDSLSSNDNIALYAVDDGLKSIVPLDTQNAVDPAIAQQAVRQAITSLEPTWNATKLASGLSGLADYLNSGQISGNLAGKDTEIVLVSDLHVGSGLESLQGYPWPESVRLDVRSIVAAVPGNASVRIIESDDSEQKSSDPVRVRIENNADSDSQTITVGWSNGGMLLDGKSTRVQVPAGQVRVLPLEPQPLGADRIALMGDAWDADNEVFVVNVEPRAESIAFLGKQPSEKTDDLGYFLKQAPLDSRWVQRSVRDVPLAELESVLADETCKAIVLEPVQGISDSAKRLREFASSGGTVLVALSRPLSDQVEVASFVGVLLATDNVKISESSGKEFALVGSVDYQNPIFAPFADPRFNDFSKIRFWSHRVIDLPQNDQIAVVASFDDGSPMLLQSRVGNGAIWVLAAGWQPDASSLGLSSKFVPILRGLLDPAGIAQEAQMTYEVGDPIAIETKDLTLKDMDGVSLTDEEFEVIGDSALRIFKPGLFQIANGEMQLPVAIQVPASESQTLPLDAAVFEQYGVVTSKLVSNEERKEQARQLQVSELEQRQRMWQWLIAAGIVVLAFETWLAGLAARKSDLVVTAT